MTDNDTGRAEEKEEARHHLVEEAAEVETGKRHPHGYAAWLVAALLLGWALFQLSVAGFVNIDASRARAVHLLFASILTFLLFPATRKNRIDTVPWYDWLLAAISAATILYLLIDYEGLQRRPGAPLLRDLIVGGIGLLILMETARRALGPALTVVATLFLSYSYFGPYLPEILIHRGYSFGRIIDHQFLTSEGVFGTPLGVSAAFVFLFVLFGALLDKAGAGAYFIQLSYSLLGRFRGGPAKAAILASGLTGMVNGSSTANTVTTGAFTIPLMKQVGYPAEKAAAIEVAASTNGQLMPPIMGAAAFIIAEFLGISYFEVVKAAIIPALASYLTLFYIAHLEALKLGMEGQPKEELPLFFDTFLRGAHFLIPVVALVVALLYYRLSPVASAFNAISVLLILMVIQRPLLAFRHHEPILPAILKSFNDIYDGMISGSRNMISVAIATAAAGIIVGTVTLTGLGLRAVEIVEVLSMGSLALALIITATSCLILGMGLPTTANYIVMATLAAPVIVALGEAGGLVVPLIAAHLFVFYFGILADDTPPVGLAAYAAAGIAGSDPIKTGIQGFIYDMRTAVLPFMFIFNTQILLIGVDSFLQGLFIFSMTIIGMFAFASSTQGFLITKLNWLERVLLLAGALLIVNPHLLDFITGVSVGYFYSTIGVALFAIIVARQWTSSKQAKTV